MPIQLAFSLKNNYFYVIFKKKTLELFNHIALLFMPLIYIELFFCFILFQTISLVHRKKVSLYFAYPFFSHSKKDHL